MLLSVVIITFNEERNIARCIDSVQSLADEIIVLDSNSTDNTRSIATDKGAIVYQQPFLGYIEQKNRALALASNNFVLSLDADEALDRQLQISILEVKRSAASGPYSMNRCTNYCGKPIRHGLWYPDKKLRLFERTNALWGGDNPHDKIVLKEPSPTRHLKGDILHYSINTMEEHIAQYNRFSSISAETLFNRNKKTTLLNLLFNPCWAFVNGYFFRLGFLDGFYGYVIAKNTAHLTFLKHSKLYQKQRAASSSLS